MVKFTVLRAVVYCAAVEFGCRANTWLDALESRGYAVNKMKIILAVTHVWAYACIYLNRSFEKILRAVLLLPENFLDIPARLASIPHDTEGNPIEIISARAEGGARITNKLRVVLGQIYQYASPTTPHDTNGFDVRQCARLLNSSIIWCSYAIRKKEKICPEKFFEHIKHALFTLENGTSYETKNNTRRELFMDHADFDDQRMEHNDTTHDLDDLLSELE